LRQNQHINQGVALGNATQFQPEILSCQRQHSKLQFYLYGILHLYFYSSTAWRKGFDLMHNLVWSKYCLLLNLVLLMN